MISDCPALGVKRVSFAYPRTGIEALSDVSFSLGPGEVIAILGENGSGKSSLIKLWAGLYYPSSGEVLFDGFDIRELERSQIRKTIAVMLQDFQAYKVSVRDNIAFDHFDAEVRAGAVEDVVRRIGLDGVLGRHGLEYDTLVGRHFTEGGNSSGGERQLIALARVLGGSAPICILNEPTSALSAQNDARAYKEILSVRERGGRSVVLVTHRLAITHRVDRVLLFANGRLVDSGNHNELLGLGGKYAELWNAYHAPDVGAGREFLPGAAAAA